MVEDELLIDEPEDIVDSMRELTDNVWFKAVEEREYITEQQEEPTTYGEKFPTREGAVSYAEDEGLDPEEDVEKCGIPVGLRTLTNGTTDPIRYIGHQVDTVEDMTEADKQALYGAIASTYELLEELQLALIGELDRVQHPQLQHGQRDKSYKCHPTPVERKKIQNSND